jgi:pilus assembly protein Flp/PilA
MMKALSDFFLALYVKAVSAVRSEKGQTLVEYALILVLIALVVILALTTVGEKVNNTFSNIASELK